MRLFGVFDQAVHLSTACGGGQVLVHTVWRKVGWLPVRRNAVRVAVRSTGVMGLPPFHELRLAAN